MHLLLSACAPPTWPVCVVPTGTLLAVSLAASASVMPVPVVKLMPSWQAPQASVVGLFFQLSPSAVTFWLPTARAVPAMAVPVWHVVQFLGSCDKRTALNICAPPLLLKLYPCS